MTAIVIVAIVCWAIVEIVNGNKSTKKGKQDVHKTTDLELQITKLKERVATLEKIVTDEKYDLNRQFNDLKKDHVA